MTLSGGIINTLFALIFAIVLVGALWGMVMYFTEGGSEEGRQEGKELLLGAVTLLFLLMCVYAFVVWARAAVGV